MKFSSLVRKLRKGKNDQQDCIQVFEVTTELQLMFNLASSPSLESTSLLLARWGKVEREKLFFEKLIF